jgi:hypothetical protein
MQLLKTEAAKAEGAGRAKDAVGGDKDGAVEPAARGCLSASGAAASLTRARLGTSRRTPISNGKARKQRWRGGKESAANQEGVHAVGEVGEHRTMARIGEARPWAPRNSLEEEKTRREKSDWRQRCREIGRWLGLQG